MVGIESAFPEVSPDTIDFAKNKCLDVLNDERTPERVRKYYDADTNCLGRDHRNRLASSNNAVSGHSGTCSSTYS